MCSSPIHDLHAHSDRLLVLRQKQALPLFFEDRPPNAEKDNFLLVNGIV